MTNNKRSPAAETGQFPLISPNHTHHRARRPFTGRTLSAVLLVGLAIGIAPPDVTGDSRSYTIDDDGRFLGVRYGDPESILAIVGQIRAEGADTVVDQRSVKLPNERAFDTFTLWHARFPESCGGSAFSLFSAHELLVLEYRHRLEDGRIVRIRDQISGSGPYHAPGLWGPGDHTLDGIDAMVLVAGRGEDDGLGLHRGAYEIGWMTTLSPASREHLGQAYADAVSMASHCRPDRRADGELEPRPQPAALAAPISPPASAAVMPAARRYVVQPQDSLRSIAGLLYGDASLWRVIYERNTPIIGEDPDNLRRGMVLEIP